MVPHAIAGAVVAAALCAGCCDSVDTTTWQGTLQYSFPASAMSDADAGASHAAPFVGSLSTVVALDAFAPWVQNGFSGGYCGGNDFTVDLGPSCQLAATVGTADYSGKYASDTGSATITADQQCTLSTSSGTFTISVQGGNLAISGSVLNILVDTPGANLEFQGNLQ